jgi:replicative DNA helicase
MGRKFAGRQMAKPEEQRVGTLICSLEMGEEPSSTRVGQAVGSMDGGKLREGKLTPEELEHLKTSWAGEADWPLYYNHASIISAPQFKAVVVESIRRHNVGLVIVDHWRYVKMPGKFASRADEDGEKAEFFKQRIAKDLNVACVVLAHTVKGVENRDAGRPKLSDLRGSGDIAAEADFVAFMYRPYQHATRDAIEEQRVSRTDAELIYEKNRHGLEDAAKFYFDPALMLVK